MRWATRELIHFDRIASAWLILRFIDPAAIFSYLKEGESAAEDVLSFGVPGVQLAMHDGESTTFERIIKAYSISGDAIKALSGIISDGVQHVMLDALRSDASNRSPLAAGALAFTEGVFVTSTSDQECLQRCLPLYDALYARLLAQSALDQNVSFASQSVLKQTLAVASAIRELREQQSSFTQSAFAKALTAASAPKAR